MTGTSYYWYRTTQSSYGEYLVYFHMGVKYLLFLDEPTYEVQDKLNLVYVGKGDINYLNKVDAL